MASSDVKQARFIPERNSELTEYEKYHNFLSWETITEITPCPEKDLLINCFYNFFRNVATVCANGHLKVSHASGSTVHT